MTTLLAIEPNVIKNLPAAVVRKLGGMDETTQLAYAQEFKRRMKSPALAFWLMLPAGLHYAYVGKVWITLVFWCTMGGLGVWWFADLFRVWGLVRRRNEAMAIEVLRDIQVLN